MRCRKSRIRCSSLTFQPPTRADVIKGAPHRTGQRMREAPCSLTRRLLDSHPRMTSMSPERSAASIFEYGYDDEEEILPAVKGAVPDMSSIDDEMNDAQVAWRKLFESFPCSPLTSSRWLGRDVKQHPCYGHCDKPPSTGHGVDQDADNCRTPPGVAHTTRRKPHDNTFRIVAWPVPHRLRCSLKTPQCTQPAVGAQGAL